MVIKHNIKTHAKDNNNTE